jgi:catechol 2,3-dioxygenase-like lactoylglutathione lyase family enzyme
MSRMQLALNVDALDVAVAFYTRLLGVEPAKTRPGYANFAVADAAFKLVLLENPGSGGTLNHLGIEVDSTERVQAETARLTEHGLLTDVEEHATCCYATQDKVWVTGPGGEQWEVYTVLADSPVFGAGPGQGDEDAGCSSATTADEPAAAACCA